jgi:hypothetical protein
MLHEKQTCKLTNQEKTVALKTLYKETLQDRKYITVLRVSYTCQSHWSPPNSNATYIHVEREAKPPLLSDLNKHHRQRSVLSWWTCPPQAARHMSLWDVSWGHPRAFLDPDPPHHVDEVGRVIIDPLPLPTSSLKSRVEANLFVWTPLPLPWRHTTTKKP